MLGKAITDLTKKMTNWQLTKFQREVADKKLRQRGEEEALLYAAKKWVATPYGYG